MEVCPPGGMETRDVGRSVMTLNELVLLEEAKALLEMAVVDGVGTTDSTGLTVVVAAVVRATVVEGSTATAGSELSLFSLPAEVGAVDSLLLELGVKVPAVPAAIFSRCSFS